MKMSIILCDLVIIWWYVGLIAILNLKLFPHNFIGVLVRVLQKEPIRTWDAKSNQICIVLSASEHHNITSVHNLAILVVHAFSHVLNRLDLGHYI